MFNPRGVRKNLINRDQFRRIHLKAQFPMNTRRNAPLVVDQEDLHRALRAEGILFSKLVRPMAFRLLFDIAFD